MDEALDLSEYLPVSLQNPGEQEYISLLWEAFQSNYEAGIYHFAFLAYHLLMMSFVYFNFWKIRKISFECFSKGLNDFSRRDRDTLINGTSPFAFSLLNEKAIFGLLEILGGSQSQVDKYKLLVDDRNEAAHANGNIYFRTQPEIDAKIRLVIQSVEEIQSHFRSTIDRCYSEFLLQSHNPNEREYPNSEDQIREVLIHDNYMSQKDIEICVNFDVSSLESGSRNAIEALHNTLCETYTL